MKTLIHPRTGVLAAMILTAGLWRLFISSGNSPLTNFTPIGAMALFGGCYFSDKWKAFLVPILTLWLSDLFLNYFVYYHEWRFFSEGFIFNYGSFALIVLMGRFMKKATVKNVLITTVSAAMLHWIITDLGLWLDGTMYPMNSTGFVACYVAALPFLLNMLIGNLIFGAILFGSFELAQRRFPVLSLKGISKNTEM
ncbi:MAG: hypothetical protein HY064_06330 [Bacteroidetes bacterium]|nr:hypothetical protein [Bacteroidota bacterium]